MGITMKLKIQMNEVPKSANLMRNTKEFACKINSTTLVLLCFLFSIPNLFAQTLIDDTRTLKVLVFEHEQKDKKKLISQTGIIKYKLRSDPKVVHKGRLDDIKEGAMVVNGKEVKFEDCIMIAGRVNTEEALVGGICVGIGFSGMIAGAALLGNIVVGGTVALAGVAALVAGIILITKMKRFNLDKGWEVHSGKIIYSPTG